MGLILIGKIIMIDFYHPEGLLNFSLSINDDGQEEAKNFFSKNNAFRNISVQSFGKYDRLLNIF
jgi:hypothetical protein